MIIINNMLKKFNKKSVEELNDVEVCILNAALRDNAKGRYSKFLMWSSDERQGFLDYLTNKGENIHTINDPTRWAFEDAYHASLFM